MINNRKQGAIHMGFINELGAALQTFLRLLVTFAVAAVLFPLLLVAEFVQSKFGKWYCFALTENDVHIDVPLSNLAVKAFGQGNLVAEALFPPVPVDKRSNKYYTVTKADWLRLPNTTLRGPKQAPNRIEFSVSSDSYFAHNYALAAEASHESMVNADAALRVRQRNSMLVTSVLRRDLERRVALKCTSITNLGSGVSLTGGNKWSAGGTSDPIADVNTGHAFIRNNTGLTANVAVIDYDTMVTLRRHPLMLDLYKQVQGGQVTDAQIAEQFRVQRILIADAILENAKEGGTSSMTNMWGNICLLAHVEPAQSMEDVTTFGLGFRWTDPMLGVPFGIRLYDDPDPGKKIEIQEASYYQDEKIVAQQLSYLVNNTL
jgi:hypothetical protein